MKLKIVHKFIVWISLKSIWYSLRNRIRILMMPLNFKICIYAFHLAFGICRILFAHKSRFSISWVIRKIITSVRRWLYVAAKSFLILKYVFQNTAVNVRFFGWTFISCYAVSVLINTPKTWVHTLRNWKICVADIDIQIIKVIVWFCYFLLFNQLIFCWFCLNTE